jgi:hypothetical protein
MNQKAKRQQYSFQPHEVADDSPFRLSDTTVFALASLTGEGYHIHSQHRDEGAALAKLKRLAKFSRYRQIGLAVYRVERGALHD